MSITIPEAVQEPCLAFPRTGQKRSHCMPDFRVNGRPHAYFTVNHHGDGRVALWLEAPDADRP